MSCPTDRMIHVLIVLVVVLCTSSSAETLEDALHHYETLHHGALKISHRSRRSLGGHGGVVEKQVTFDTLGKHFRLGLLPQRGLFTRDFRAYVINSKNEKVLFNIDRSNFYEGHLIGEVGPSRVLAHFEGDNLVATIRTSNETYVIEPSWRHLEDSNLHTMISYRKSDMKLVQKKEQLGSFCGFVHPDGVDEAAYTSQNDVLVARDQYKYSEKEKATQDKHRFRRGVQGGATTCSLMAVADYHFYTDIGQNNTATTANYLVGQIQNVDSLYRGTDFGSGFVGMGFELSGLKLYSEPTAVAAGQTHYNMERDTWETKNLLRTFAKDQDFDKYCMAHLFTNIAFSDGVLGLGWIASPKVGAVGGMCSPVSGGSHYNTAWSTMKNKNGRRILTQESQIVTSHGHNWGSQHDPATDECAPSSYKGGKYVMYTYSVSGYDTNNRDFSPCSKRSIASVLSAKSAGCFQAKKTNFCGNHHVETPYEECDAGMGQGSDPCCDENCKFRTGAVCSDRNTLCCQACQYAPNTKVCRERVASNTTCEDESYCSGTTTNCVQSYKPDGSPCIDSGKCSGGNCLAFCESLGLVSCRCPSLAKSCLTCCKTNGTCVPYLGTSGVADPLADGKPCIQGICKAGQCDKLVVSFTNRLWSIIESIDINYLAKFMRNNIVLTCILLSLLIYVPLSLIVACVDWRREKKDVEEVKWMNKENDTLYLDKDQGRIRQTHTRRRPGQFSGEAARSATTRTVNVSPSRPH